MNLLERLRSLRTKKRKIEYANGVLAQFRESEAYEVLNAELWIKRQELIARLGDEDTTAEKRQFYSGALSALRSIDEVMEGFESVGNDILAEERLAEQRKKHEQMQKVSWDNEANTYTGAGATLS